MIKKFKNKIVSKCLLCGNKKLNKIFYLGNFFVSNFVNKKNIEVTLVSGSLPMPIYDDYSMISKRVILTKQKYNLHWYKRCLSIPKNYILFKKRKTYQNHSAYSKI